MSMPKCALCGRDYYDVPLIVLRLEDVGWQFDAGSDNDDAMRVSMCQPCIESIQRLPVAEVAALSLQMCEQ